MLFPNVITKGMEEMDKTAHFFPLVPDFFLEDFPPELLNNFSA
jgi:hypothetical protein